MSVLPISRGCNALSRALIPRLRPGSNRRSTWNSGLPFPWAWRRRKSWRRSAPNGRNPRGSPAFPDGIFIGIWVACPLQNVWGIGAKTTAYLAKHGIYTALAFATLPERWVLQHLPKPFYEIWQELRGTSVLALETQEKEDYQSVQKFKTFSPPSNDREFVFSQLAKNIENGCMKVRRYQLVAGSAMCFLRTQDFRDVGLEVRFSRPTAFSHEVIHALRPLFDDLFSPRLQYRSTGVMLGKLREDANLQLNLFDPPLRIDKFQRIYHTIDTLRRRYGKHTVFLGASLTAQTFTQHVGDRGDAPQRKGLLLKGETTRKRLGIPMLLGEVK